jgi:hypothetical protein
MPKVNLLNNSSQLYSLSLLKNPKLLKNNLWNRLPTKKSNKRHRKKRKSKSNLHRHSRILLAQHSDMITNYLFHLDSNLRSYMNYQKKLEMNYLLASIYLHLIGPSSSSNPQFNSSQDQSRITGEPKLNQLSSQLKFSSRFTPSWPRS